MAFDAVLILFRFFIRRSRNFNASIKKRKDQTKGKCYVSFLNWSSWKKMFLKLSVSTGSVTTSQDLPTWPCFSSSVNLSWSPSKVYLAPVQGSSLPVLCLVCQRRVLRRRRRDVASTIFESDNMSTDDAPNTFKLYLLWSPEPKLCFHHFHHQSLTKWNGNNNRKPWFANDFQPFISTFPLQQPSSHRGGGVWGPRWSEELCCLGGFAPDKVT